jgi:hypothetical protein
MLHKLLEETGRDEALSDVVLSEQLDDRRLGDAILLDPDPEGPLEGGE